MRIINKKSLFALVALIAVCLLSLTVSALGNTAVISSAEPEYNETAKLLFAQLTDTHYYPLRYCYNSDESEFFADMLTDTKVLIESSTVLKKSMDDLLAVSGEDGEGLDYLFVSGDISKDGEMAAHIDVANTLRKLQNDIRAKGNTDFQVLVIFGNHDIYNPSTYSYGGDGIKKLVNNVTRRDLTYIYSSLGYPDLTDQEILNYYSSAGFDTDFDLTTLPYEAEDSCLINSTTAANLEMTYNYTNEGIDYIRGELSYLAETVLDGQAYSFLMVDEEDSNPVDGHVLTATVDQSIMDFYTENATSDSVKISVMHHNLVPQTIMEDSLISGFIVNNWIMAADFFADLGVRYNLSGHAHSNSISYHISFNNNQITDVETSSLYSYKGGFRTFELSIGTYDGKHAEDLTSDFISMVDVDFAALMDAEYLTPEYLAANNLTQFVSAEGICSNYSEYAKTRIYENIVGNYMTGYLNPEIIPELADMVKNIIPDTIYGLNLVSLKGMIPKLIPNIVSEVETKVLADYTYSGSNPLFTGGENKLLAYLEEMLDRALGLQVASDGTTLVDLFFACYYSSIDGAQYPTEADLPANIREGLCNLKNGTAIRSLLDIVLDENTGLYRILKGLLTTELDLSANLTSTELRNLNSLGKFLMNGFDATRVNLDALVSNANKLLDLIDLGGKSVLEYLDSVLADYVTDSLMTGLGEIAANIMISFGTDDTPDVNYSGTMHITMNASNTFTYLEGSVVDNPTIANGKLPSLLTVSLGADAKTSKNIVWQTDKRITDSVVLYSTNSDMSNAVTVNGESEIYAYTMPLIDAGIFATYGISETGRHSAALTGLVPGTTYYYKVGSSEYNYWSPVYTLTTAPDDNAAFSALLFADPQGYTQNSYNDVFEVLTNVSGAFPDGYDLVIGLGDNVDNSKNADHFQYLYNTNQAFWGNTTWVTAVGNHEDSAFEFVAEDEPTYIKSSSSVITSAYNNSLLYYNVSAPEQDTESGVYYSFDYSGVHFVVLNTNDISEDNELGEGQTEWLLADLAATDKEFTVVVMHKGLYSNGAHGDDPDVIGMRAQLTPIFTANGVDLVLSGHDHTYNVTYYLDENGERCATPSSSKISGKGTIYITLGTVGDKFYDYVDNGTDTTYYGEEFHDPTLSNPIFGKLTYDGENLYFEAYQYDMETGEINELKPLGFAAVAAIVSVSIALLGGGAALAVKFLRNKKKVV